MSACAVAECGKPTWARGLCSMHLTRLRRHGTTDDPKPTAAQRFWAKVDKNGPLPEWRPELGGCWLWRGAKTREGYGFFFPERRSPVGPHRWAYMQEVGPIADGLHLDHLCRVPSCVRPSHLEPVTVRENTIRGNEARKALAS